MGIREVAKLAGVSVSTVSRTLNETTYVKDETRLRVLDAAHRLNYSPNAFAKGLKSNKSNTIALVIPDISNMIFPKITQGVEKVMRKNGYITVLCNTGEDCGAEQDYIKFLTGQRIDGFIFATLTKNTAYINELRDQGIPVVLAGRYNDESIAAIGVDNFKAGYEATKYQIEIGHQKIVFVMGNPKLCLYEQRLAGYKKALEDYGLKFREEYVLYELYDSISLYSQTRKLFERIPDIEAIVASSDPKAFMLMRALRDMGKDIPGDVSIVGIDDVEFSSIIDPPLSTVAQPLTEMGELAAKKLIAQIKHKEKTGKLMEPTVDILDVKLIVRGTTRKRRQNESDRHKFVELEQ